MLNISAFKKWLNSKAAEKAIDRYFRQEERKRNKRLKFFESIDFCLIYTLILDHISEYAVVVADDLLYDINKKYTITYDDFMNVFNSVIEAKHKQIKRINSEFPIDYIKYGTLYFIMMHGLGTACWVSCKKPTK